VSRRRVLIATIAVMAVTGSGCSTLGIGGAGTYEIGVEFDRAYNLFPGSPVRVLGTEVGTVKDLSVDPERDSVLVSLAIDDEVAIPADANAVILVASLLGERYVQLDPAFTASDEALEPGAIIPIDRTLVPAEFDEVLESLNQFVGGLDEDEFGRLITNLADVLEGQGETLGRTIDQAHEAVQVLADNDEDIIALLDRLSDLNETLATRDQTLGQLIEDWNTVSGYLAADRADIDAALSGLARLTTALADVLEDHRLGLEADFQTITRITRTAVRNIDQVSLLVLSGAELFRHSERVFDFQRNWLPLVNHSGELEGEIARTVGDRLVGVCENAGLPDEVCATIPDLVAGVGEICLPPAIPCAEEQATVADALRASLEGTPGLAEAMLEQRAQDAVDLLPPEAADALRGTDREVAR
jgi:virulence factor Mce-like protein